MSTEAEDTCGLASIDLGAFSINTHLASQILHDMPLAMAVITKDGRVRWVNGFYQKVLDRTEGSILSRVIFELIHEDYLSDVKSYCQKLESGDLKSFSLTLAHKREGDRPEKRRLAYGAATIWRFPEEGELKHCWVFFQPHNGLDERPKAKINLAEWVAFLKENGKWIAALIGIMSALIGGNSIVTQNAIQKAQQVEEKLQILDSQQPQSPPS